MLSEVSNRHHLDVRQTDASLGIDTCHLLAEIVESGIKFRSLDLPFGILHFDALLLNAERYKVL